MGSWLEEKLDDILSEGLPSSSAVKCSGTESLGDFYGVLSEEVEDRPVIVDQPFEGREKVEEFFENSYTVEYWENRSNAEDRYFVENPADLTGRGIALSEVLDHATANYSEAPVLISEKEGVVNQHVEDETHYRFLHNLDSRLTSTDATGIYGFHESLDEKFYAKCLGIMDAEIDLKSENYRKASF